LAVATLVATAMLIGASAAQAANPEQRCQRGRYAAAGKYIACQQRVMAALFGGVPPSPDVVTQGAFSECRVKYTALWSHLQAKASGTGATCDNTRFLDNGDGTVTDRLTVLQWEKKTIDATVHDKANQYSWNAGAFTAADGTAFTSFLVTLDGGGCFAGQCDWRLPTIYELQTILLAPYSCTTSPCIDAVFGATGAGAYWSATTFATEPFYPLDVNFSEGSVNFGAIDGVGYVRAVRGGL
jgi:hypothetical protein